jgi:hypothetical protein
VKEKPFLLLVMPSRATYQMWGMLVTLLMTVFGNALTVGLLLVSAEAFSHFAIYQEKVN